MEKSFLFEANAGRHVGFDFDTVRLIRVTGINSFDVAYSLQGSIQRSSFVTTPRYIRKNEGIEKDITTNPLDWEISFWKLHTITGAAVGRIIANQSGAHIEGTSPIDDEEFESDFRQARTLIERLPAQSKSHGEGSVEQQESTQLEEVILKLTDAWLAGRLSPTHREKVAAICYLSNIKKLELGWSASEPAPGSTSEPSENFEESAKEWTEEESLWGTNLKSLLGV